MNPITETDIQAAATAYATHGSIRSTAAAIGMSYGATQKRIKRAAEAGLLGTSPVLPGFRIAKVSNTPRGDYVQQKPELGEEYKPIDTLTLKGRTSWNVIQPDGTRIAEREVVMERADVAAQRSAMEAVAAALAEKLPRETPIAAPTHTNADLLNQYTVTDLHMGALAWNEETGRGDYDLAISERLIEDWFAAAIALAPASDTAILAQLGDLVHWDGFESVTPTSRHVLDGDSRFDKMVWAAIRVFRKVVRMLLQKHRHVHILMCDANHDPASESWMRGWMDAFYEEEPRVTVDRSAGTYYAYQHGDVSLFFHHGHRRKIANIDSVFAGQYREMYGATKHSYAHLGHLHSDELRSTNLMKVERHETLAAPDAYAANGGWLSGRSAKVITYHKSHGEVGRLTLTPGMVAGASRAQAANDNEPRRAAA